MNVAAVVVAVHDALDAAGLDHAFGGAIALAYAVGEPRATIDVDVNVFVDATAARGAFDALPAGVAWSTADVERAERDGQVRVRWEEVPLDLFFDYHPFHRQAARTARRVPFAGTTIPVLAPDELAVFKAFFDRRKDWADIEAMAEAGSFDAVAVLAHLADLLGDDDARLDRLRALLAEVDGERATTMPRLP